MRIAHNLVIDHFRKNSRLPKFENSHDFDIFSVLKNTDIDIENNGLFPRESWEASEVR